MKINICVGRAGVVGTANNESGAVLVIGLIFMAVLALMGTGAMDIVTSDIKLAGNIKDKQYSFFFAESVLKRGERWLLRRGEPPDTGWPVDKDSDRMPTILVGKTSVQWSGLVGATSDEKSWKILSADEVEKQGQGSSSEPVDRLTGTSVVIFELLGHRRDSLNVGRGSVDDERGQFFYRVTARGEGARMGSDNSSVSNTLLQSVYSVRFD